VPAIDVDQPTVARIQNPKEECGKHAASGAFEK
jgi:hypothetical protein